MFTKNALNARAMNSVGAHSIDKTPIVTTSGAAFSQYANKYEPTVLFTSIASLMRATGAESCAVGGYTTNSSSNTATGNFGVVFGTGTVEPTQDDIKLSGSAVTTYNKTMTSSSERGDDYIEYTYIYTLTNTASEAITIGEIGLFDKAYWGTQNYGVWYGYLYLVDRTVLETPVTIEPGGVGQITYTIRMYYMPVK